MTLFIVNGEFFHRATHALPVFYAHSGEVPDNNFFISLISSFRDGNFYSIYEQGTIPVYQNLGALSPSFIACFTRVSSQTALYGMYLPFCVFTMTLFMIEIVRLFLQIDRYAIIYYPLTVLSFICLQPIHIGYLLKLKINSFVFGGIGYVGPSMNIGYMVAMPLVLIILILVFQYPTYKTQQRYHILLTILVGLLMGIKVPMFILCITFIGFVICFDFLYEKQYHLIKTLFFSLIVGLVMYFLLYNQSSYLKTYLGLDYMPKYINEYFKLGTESLLIQFLVFTAFVTYLFSFRILIFFKPMITSDGWLEKIKYSTLLTLVTLYLFSYLYNVKIVDESGVEIRDGSFDALQFPRVGFFLLTIISVIYSVWVFKNRYGVYRKIFAGVFVLNFTIVVLYYINVFLRNSNEPLVRGGAADRAWLSSIQKIHIKPSDGYLVIDPINTQYNIIAPASDIGVFWVSFGNNSYNYAKRVQYERKRLYDSILWAETPSSEAIRILKLENAKYFIATPLNLSKFSELTSKGYFKVSPLSVFLHVLQ